MYRNKIFSVAIITVISIQTIISQNNTNSPYTRFGYGEISDNTSGEQRAMGGTGIGARSANRINTVNPASYSVSDSLTFMFDFGASALISSFSDDASRKKNTFNANLEYLTLQFRLFKGAGLSAGILPYSFAGYNYYTDSYKLQHTYADVPDTVKYTQSFSGTGGINQFFLGLSFDLFNHVSLGANAYYMFGNYDNLRNLVYSNTNYASTYQTNSISVNSFRFRFGAQYYNTFAQKHDLTLGLIYEPKMALKGEANQITTGTIGTDTINLSDGFELPQTFGAGLYYTYDHKWSVGIDYSLRQWNNTLFYGEKNALVNSSKLAVGLEYQPNYRGRKFGDRIMYRIGANMSDPYYKISGTDMGKNLGLTCGIGFPLPSSSRTMINMSFEYGKMGTALLKENYYKFTFNFSLAETWFFKRKL